MRNLDGESPKRIKQGDRFERRDWKNGERNSRRNLRIASQYLKVDSLVAPIFIHHR